MLPELSLLQQAAEVVLLGHLAPHLHNLRDLDLVHHTPVVGELGVAWRNKIKLYVEVNIFSMFKYFYPTLPSNISAISSAASSCLPWCSMVALRVFMSSG